MKFENTEIFNFEGALRGMRNPLASWRKTDSYYDDNHEYIIGKNDMTLAVKLCESGPEHRKFLRQIQVSVDITAPLFWWKEFDTYKIGTTANSTSTMHKIAQKEISIYCFEIDDYNSEYCCENEDGEIDINITEDLLIPWLESLRLKYIKTKDKKYWKELIRWLPESWLQMRTVTLNYEVIRTIYHQRKEHKLTEWSKSFIEWAESLPYAKEFIIN